MMKENEKDLQKTADEKLTDDVLAQVSGGHIELVEDEPIKSKRGGLHTDPLSRGDYQA